MLKPSNKPLVVDLDGTLIHSDLLHESLLAFILKNPTSIFLPFKWFLKGKPNLKKHLAQRTQIDVETLPYDQRVIELIKIERAKGRKIILATASHIIYAKQIADHLKLFDEVFATESDVNLSAQNKCNKLVKEFGAGGFDYVGNSRDDLAVWNKSKAAILVNANRSVTKKAQALGNVEQIIPFPKNIFKVWAKALRLHQWVKNFLIFVPLLASHKIEQVDLLFNGALAFLFFGCCASHVYLFNDLVDLKNDRLHATKRFRPLASGLISATSSLVMSFALLLVAFVGSFYFLPLWFGLSLVAYYILTLAYSLVLKRLAMLDIISLAALYTMRIIAGAFAFGELLTFWMLAFSMFIFLSLSLVKRYAELYEQRAQGKKEKTHGRGYYPSDLEMLSSLGAASGYLSVMILALYVQDKLTISLYSHPRIIWFACPLLLYWISRVWMLTHRGQMYDDPVVFAIKDKVSWLVGGLLAIVFWLAI
jgi:4-hydroxybenzoate polyprenyltransferase